MTMMMSQSRYFFRRRFDFFKLKTRHGGRGLMSDRAMVQYKYTVAD
jgi:hypothetical protein